MNFGEKYILLKLYLKFVKICCNWISISLTIVLLCSSKLLAVDNNITVEKDSLQRKNYIFVTVGLIEPLGFGMGIQIDESTAIGIKYSGYWLSHFEAGNGLGIKLTHSTGIKFIKMINFEVTPHIDRNHHDNRPFIHGASVELNVGYDNFNKKVFNVVWSIGAVGSFGRGVPPLFAPNLKLGICINI